MERWGLGKGINSGTTGLCNQNRIVVEEMSLESFNMTYRDEDTHVRPNMSKANIFALLLWWFEILKLIEENTYLKKCTLQQGTHKTGV